MNCRPVRLLLVLVLAQAAVLSSIGLRPAGRAAGASAPVAWSATALRNAKLTVLAVAPANGKIAYAGDLGGRLYRTTDSGRTFKVTKQKLAAPVRGIGIVSAHPTTIYVLDNRGLVKSTNGGDSAARIGKGLPGAATLHSITLEGSHVLYVAAAGGLWRSSNDGGTFGAVRLAKSTVKGTPTDVWAVQADAKVAKRLYAITAAGIQVSSDDGRTWRLDASTAALARVFVAPKTAGGTVYLLTALGHALTFTGDGRKDALQQVHTPTTAAVSDLAVGTHGALYAGTQRNGVYTSTDGGQTWRQVNSHLASSTVLQLGQTTAATSPTIYALTPTGVFRCANC